MSKDKKTTAKKLVSLTPDVEAAIEKIRRTEFGVLSRNAVVTDLLRKALKLGKQ